jgi:ubiquinone biosynthesis protein
MEFPGALLVAAVAIATIALYVLVIRRLLDFRTGFLRTAAAAVLALYLAPTLLQAFGRAAGLTPVPVAGEDPDLGLRTLFLCLAVLAATVAAMVVLVLAELLVPTGSVPGPLGLVRGGRARYRRLRRYLQILRIAVRHDLGRFLRGASPARHPGGRRELAQSLRDALAEGGVTFVKLGQVLSTRADLLPAEFVEELSTLQARADPMSWEQVRGVLDAELGGQVDGIFAAIEPAPLAAASIGQVHSAQLVSGGEVVVKVQRPDIRPVLERDLDIIGRLADTVARRTRWGRALGVRELADGFAALREELDFTVERDNVRAVAAATARDAVSVAVPRPHADPHPGNVLVTADGDVGLLDFGSVGRLDGTTRQALGRLLLAIDRMDSLAASDALLELVDRPGRSTSGGWSAPSARSWSGTPRPARPSAPRRSPHCSPSSPRPGCGSRPTWRGCSGPWRRSRGRSPSWTRSSTSWRPPGVSAGSGSGTWGPARSGVPWRTRSSPCCRCCADCPGASTASPTPSSTAS